MIIFAHIEKTGGTSLNGVLRTYHGIRFAHVRALLHPGSPGERAVHLNDLKLFKKLTPVLDCVSGHAVRPWLLLNEGLRNSLFLTVFREPVSRYVSYYTYGGGAQRKPWPYTFEEYLEMDKFKNFQVKRIAGTDNANAAIDIIEGSFAAVANLECMDELLSNLDKIWPGIYRDAKHVGRRNERIDTKRESLQLSFQEKLLENNLEDIKLYEYIKNNYNGLYLRSELFAGGLGEKNNQRILGRGVTGRGKELISIVFRKVYLDPITGLVRLAHGLPYKGTY